MFCRSNFLLLFRILCLTPGKRRFCLCKLCFRSCGLCGGGIVNRPFLRQSILGFNKRTELFVLRLRCTDLLLHGIKQCIQSVCGFFCQAGNLQQGLILCVQQIIFRRSGNGVSLIFQCGELREGFILRFRSIKLRFHMGKRGFDFCYCHAGCGFCRSNLYVKFCLCLVKLRLCLHQFFKLHQLFVIFRPFCVQCFSGAPQCRFCI